MMIEHAGSGEVLTIPVAGASPRRAAFRRRAARILSDNYHRAQLRLRAIQFGCRLLPMNMFGRGRALILHLGGANVTSRTFLYGAIELHGAYATPSHLTLGREVKVSPHCSFDLTAPVTVEDGVAIGHNVVIITAEHELGPPETRCGPLRPRAVHIGQGAWIGACSTILPGVTIGAGSVVSAGSTAFHDVPPNMMVAGSPARALKRLPGAETSEPLAVHAERAGGD